MLLLEFLSIVLSSKKGSEKSNGIHYRSEGSGTNSGRAKLEAVTLEIMRHVLGIPQVSIRDVELGRSCLRLKPLYHVILGDFLILV